MDFKTWFQQFENTMVAGTGTPGPEDAGLYRTQTRKPVKQFSDLAAKVFLSKDKEKRKQYKLKHQRDTKNLL